MSCTYIALAIVSLLHDLFGMTDGVLLRYLNGLTFNIVVLAGGYSGNQHTLHISAARAEARGDMQERLHAGPQRIGRSFAVAASRAGQPADLSF